MSKIVVVHVGANTTRKGGRFRPPIFSDGSFIFIQFPEKEGNVHDPELPTYKDLGWEQYVRADVLNRRVHLDPNFKTLTYCHMRRPNDDVIFDLKDGAGYLFFMASLAFNPSKGIKRLPWINPNWGAYLVGGFKVDYVLTQDEFVTAPRDVRQKFRESPHFTIRNSEPYADMWISGNERIPLETAVPLSDPNEPTKPNAFTKAILRTGKGNRITENIPFYRLILTCEENTQDFWKEVVNKNPNLKRASGGI